MKQKLFSQSCENNKQPILKVLQHYFCNATRVLEIGSGSGQHAVYFAEKLSPLFWQTSDQQDYHASINAWIDDVCLENIGRPKTLNVSSGADWQQFENQQLTYDAVFSANTAHIMGWDDVVAMFAGVANVLTENGYFLLYGPFNHNGEFTSDSNYQFHLSLRRRDNKMGIRDDQDIDMLGRNTHLVSVDDIAMPANNRILVFQRQSIE